VCATGRRGLLADYIDWRGAGRASWTGRGYRGGANAIIPRARTSDARRLERKGQVGTGQARLLFRAGEQYDVAIKPGRAMRVPSAIASATSWENCAKHVDIAS